MVVDEAKRARIEASVAVVNAVYGAPERIAALARDLVEHWENHSHQMSKFIEAPGKAMVVGGTREICAKLYAAIVQLRPDWHANELGRGKIRVVYSGAAADVPPVSARVRRDLENAAIKERFKNVDDELELVIVKDVMLTGFDALLLQTLAEYSASHRATKPAGKNIDEAVGMVHELVAQLRQILAGHDWKATQYKDGTRRS